MLKVNSSFSGIALILAFFTHFAAQAARLPHPLQITASEEPDVGPQSSAFILPKKLVTPFDQWMGNNGYCGEVSLIQAAMNQGEWMSQYNARLVCGTGLSQSGKDGFCAAHEATPNYNAQLLLESPLTGDLPFANAGQCLRNAKLAYTLYDNTKAPIRIDGYKHFLSWIKSQVILGNAVTIGVLERDGRDPQYDHEVSVIKIGTNHSPIDSTYYADDVLYFDQHYTNGGSDTQAFSFQSLAKTREEANRLDAHRYSILVTDNTPIQTETGGNGVDPNPRALQAKHYGFSVSGVLDDLKETLPVTLSITGSSLNGHPNASKREVGYNYESPEIGGGDGNACTNAPPSQWMDLSLNVKVDGLLAGSEYNLYEYVMDGVSGIGESAALAVPTANFNAHAAQAAQVIHFTASGISWEREIETTSDKILAFRCVKADAP